MISNKLTIPEAMELVRESIGNDQEAIQELVTFLQRMVWRKRKGRKQSDLPIDVVPLRNAAGQEGAVNPRNSADRGEVGSRGR